MTQKSNNVRTALTAIAAVLAISSTSVFAQEVQDTTVEAPASDPLAPEPVITTDTAEPTAAEAVPPAAKPKVEKAETTAKTTTTARRTTVAANKPSSRAASHSGATARPAAPAPAAETPAGNVPLPVAPETLPVTEPVLAAPVEVQPIADTIAMDDALPIAGAAGLGLLALAGAGLASRRRRRRREDEEFETNQRALARADNEPESEPQMVRPEPAFARPVPQEPARPSGPATPLPAGFDISRFGRHVQAAYRGPTTDNPSLSLKNRLRRASFFDQQERRAAEQAKAAAPKPDPAWMSRKPNGSDFMFRPVASRPNLKPALQK